MDSALNDWRFWAVFLVLFGSLVFQRSFSVGVVIWRWLKEGGGNRFWAWLKGSRMTYFFGAGHPNDVLITERKLPVWGETGKYDRYITGPVIEINRGFWRRASAIRSDSPISWKIVGDFEDAGSPWINLQDCRGLPVETALRLINQYSSLQAMLDRVVELEQQLAISRLRRQESFAAMLALRQIIANGKQRYRSPAARDINSYVGIVIMKAREIGEPEPSREQISDWVRFGPSPEA